ncbi:hypothetical protein FHS43_004409 [Streptosporangium becharense]|uniref:Uncharacterized protein n=1 Tax=Streptosporangium becharense TaxID=1816182 RepID=A0A7W9IJW3_9ACTN|nr:hypothetical protein [Streptosporangium becharense]MBB2913111.1 hypothetical protein [Streptosporangium becharense]MBB5822094.1 hypothetical protein [Streptosporangium becharense]
MSIVRSTTVALAAALALGATLVTGAGAHAEDRPAVKPVGAEASSGKTSQRIAAGRTAPGEGWTYYLNGAGLYIDVDTTSAHFTGNPVYTVSVGGTDHMFELTGTSAVYNPTATGFRVYIRWSNGAHIIPDDAVTNGWYVNWIGVDNP